MPDDEPHEEFELQFSDLRDGTLPEAARAALTAHLASCAACRAAHQEFEATMAALGAIGKGHETPAPTEFGKGVEDTIARRSAGRFFGKKTLGDRVPFGVLLIIALVLLIAIVAVLWASNTGSLRYHRGVQPPALAPGAREVVPRP